MGQTEFSPIAGKSGFIQFKSLLGTYTVNTGTLMLSGITNVGARDQEEWRGFLNFDTDGGIPNGAVVTKLELDVELTAIVKTGTNPTNWRNAFIMGTFIGAALDSADWAQGTEVLDYDWTSPDNPVTATIDLGATALQYYNNSGDTDIAIWDSSQFKVSSGNWQWVGTESRFKLRVYWHIPQVIKNV